MDLAQSLLMFVRHQKPFLPQYIDCLLHSYFFWELFLSQTHVILVYKVNY